MKQIALVLLIPIALAAVGVAISVWTNVLTSQSPTGSDRAPGTILVYEVDPEKAPGNKPVDLDALVKAVAHRIACTGDRAASVEALEDGRVQVSVLGNDSATVQRIERSLSSAGTFELRILANRKDHDHSRLIEEAADKSKEDDAGRVLDADGNEIGRWVPVKTGATTRDQARVRRLVGDTESNVVRPGAESDPDVNEILVIKDEWDVTGEFLNSVRPDFDQNTGERCLSVRFNQAGAARLSGLTKSHRPDYASRLSWKLGIILDGSLYSAPTLRDVISSSCQISGGFGPQEVADLADVLNAGALPAPIRQVEKRKTGQPVEP
ncbi:MAG: hypothetical protein HQ567_05465 [Candidatus Nealsonbacteria bacterium]|nr:hypothetical protein [Candidatus Nealsonbacteria bacterium]